MKLGASSGSHPFARHVYLPLYMSCFVWTGLSAYRRAVLFLDNASLDGRSGGYLINTDWANHAPGIGGHVATITRLLAVLNHCQ